jgi:hypothetical protein
VSGPVISQTELALGAGSILASWSMSQGRFSDLLPALPGVRRRAFKAEPALTPGAAERSGAALI